MSKAGPWIALVFGAIAATASFALVIVGATGAAGARETLRNTQRLHRAQVEVARAQDRLGGNDLSDAVDSARRANAIALRVGDVSKDIVRLMDDVLPTVERILRASEQGASSTVFARDQVDVAGEILASISGFQRAVDRDAARTNAALRRVLEALRDVNSSFPGRAP
jgi:hypothetical protein